VLDEEYAINEDFQQSALQLADALDLDEIDSARIVLEAQDDMEVLGRSIFESSIIRFYQIRKYLLDCFRLILQQSIDIHGDEGIRDNFQDVVSRVVQQQEGARDPPRFVQKCLRHMVDIKGLLVGLADKLNGASVLGQTQEIDLFETIEFQRVSLVQQHESLGTIVHYLIKINYSALDDFELLLDVLRRADKYDNLLGTFLSFVNIYDLGIVTVLTLPPCATKIHTCLHEIRLTKC
jgi:nuclear pore complex protein Nup205